MPYAALEGIELYYDDIGAGAPVLVIHGLGASHDDWEYQRSAFSRRFRMIAPDLRGFGASSRIGEYTVTRHARDLWALLDLLEVDRCHVIGHSMGGAVAMQMAVERPERIRRLVLADTLPSFQANTFGKRLLFAYRYAMMGVFGPQRLAKAVARKLFPAPEQGHLRDRALKRGAVNDRAVYLDAIRNLLGWSVIPQLSRLTMPVLVLAAEHDYFPVSDATAFAAQLPNATLRVFENAHHAVPLEIPDAFNQTVIGFLAARDPSTSRKTAAPRKPAMRKAAAKKRGSTRTPGGR